MRSVALACAVLMGCYEPEAVNCTIECSAIDECAEGQLCGKDGFCASPDVAGTCKAAQSDDPQSVSLVVVIAGHGKITIDNVGNCDSDDGSMGACTFAVAPGIARQLKAVENKDREFVSWTMTCSGSQSSCMLTPVDAITQVGARFE
jgi:hypothetical protein